MDDLQQGQLEAMTSLFNRYHGPIYRYFIKLSYDNMLGQDLTQQLFIKVYEKRETFSGHAGMFRPWIYRIAHNLWLDYLRVHAPKKKVTIEWKNDLDPEAHESETEFGEEDFERLNRTIEKLPDDLQQLIILHRYQGLRYGEIAQMLHSTEGAIKVRMHRALKLLRELYFDTAKNM